MTESFKQLDEFGYVVLPAAIPATFLAELNQRIDQLFVQEGEKAGSEFKREEGCRRLANLVNKGDVFQRVIADPLVLKYVGHVLTDVKLSSLNVRSVNPNSDLRQPLHVDMSALPDEGGYWVCNTLWMLQDITFENGPLRVVPGTHRSGQLPRDVLKNPVENHPDQVVVTGAAGTVVVMNAHLWHGGMENRSDGPRRVLHAFYCRRDKPQQQYQKALLGDGLQDQLSPQLRRLLALDDPENDRLSCSVNATSGFMK